MGKSTINNTWRFPIAMFEHRMVSLKKSKNQKQFCLQGATDWTENSRSFLASESFRDTVPHVFSATYLATNTIQNIQNTVLIPELSHVFDSHFTFFLDTSIPGWLGDQHPFGTWKCRTWEGNLRVSVALNKAPCLFCEGLQQAPRHSRLFLSISSNLPLRSFYQITSFWWLSSQISQKIGRMVSFKNPHGSLPLSMKLGTYPLVI